MPFAIFAKKVTLCSAINFAQILCFEVRFSIKSWLVHRNEDGLSTRQENNPLFVLNFQSHSTKTGIDHLTKTSLKNIAYRSAKILLPRPYSGLQIATG